MIVAYCLIAVFVTLCGLLGVVAALICEKWPWLGYFPLFVAMAISFWASFPVTKYVLENFQ